MVLLTNIYAGYKVLVKFITFPRNKSLEYNTKHKRRIKMDKAICPWCGQKELEKMPINIAYVWLNTLHLEDWGCLSCGHVFFRHTDERADEYEREEAE